MRLTTSVDSEVGSCRKGTECTNTITDNGMQLDMITAPVICENERGRCDVRSSSAYQTGARQGGR